MNEKIKLRGKFKTYMLWPLWLTAILLVMNLIVYIVNPKAGGIVNFFVFLYAIAAGWLYWHNRSILVNEMVSFATHYGQVQKKLLEKLTVPHALLDREGKILWMNEEFLYLTGKDKKYRRSITSIFSSITQDKLPMQEEIREVDISYQEHDYRVRMKRVEIDELLESSEIVDVEKDQSYLVALYLFDETELNLYIKKNKDEQMVSGLLYLDNCEEATENLESTRSGLFVALVESRINKYFSSMDVIVRKLEKDKYFFVMKRKTLDILIENKFSILEDVKGVNVKGLKMPVTMSIGVGMGCDTFVQCTEYAHTAIEMALGRGGDQAVVKEGKKITYFGAKSQMVEKTTRVKARVKALALKEFMKSKDKVVVMGHRITDVDSFGAAVGIYRAARTLDKKAYIVLNDPTSSICPLMEAFIKSKEHGPEMFVTNEEAKELMDENTVLVVVDTNRKNYVECEELLSMTKTIVVLDHHRQGQDVIPNPVLSYIEPYASSASEMIAEILQYFAEGIRIDTLEADSIYAGIMIDTNNFLSKTGVRTFEAAAFLRRCGADVTRVRKLFRENIDNYRARGDAISNAEVFREYFAISVCDSEGLESPTVVGAQAANELLNVVGVKASFVLTDYKDMIYISARSIDEINVQIIMERMGGGGHLNMAGTQLANHTIEEAKEILKKTLQTMLDDGDI